MADYKRMYAVLCVAVDKAIDYLDSIPSAEYASESLRYALLEAEEIFIQTADAENEQSQGD